MLKSKAKEKVKNWKERKDLRLVDQIWEKGRVMYNLAIHTMPEFW